MNPGPIGRLALAVAILVLAWAVTSCDSAPPDVTSTSQTSGAPSLTTTEMSAAADRGVRWLAAQGSALPPYVGLLLDYMHRRFGTVVPPEAAASARTAAAAGGETGAQMRVYLRLLDPAVVITAPGLAGLSDEVDRITGPALACDQVTLPAGYGEMLQRAVDLGGYERTHAVLALQWLREQNCIPDDEAAGLADRWADNLVETVERERSNGNGSSDLAIEAMAMLAYTGHADRIEGGWVTAVLDAQNDGGSWPHGGSGQVESPHATVLAAWLLSQLAHPDTPQKPWIPQP